MDIAADVAVHGQAMPRWAAALSVATAVFEVLTLAGVGMNWYSLNDGYTIR